MGGLKVESATPPLLYWLVLSFVRYADKSQIEPYHSSMGTIVVVVLWADFMYQQSLTPGTIESDQTVRWVDYSLCWVPMLRFCVHYKDSHRSLVFKMSQTSNH